MTKILQNINVLDLTTSTEQALEGVSKIQNVNALFFSKATSGLLSKITLENVNMQVEIPENCVPTVVNGRYEVADALSVDRLLFLLVNGVLLVRPEAKAEELEKGIAGILVNGTIYCPESLKGVVQQKIIQNNGKIATYMNDASLISDAVRLDNAFLQTLQPGSTITFGGKVSMLDDVDTSLLDEKLNQVEFLSTFLVREHLLPSIVGKIVNAHKSKITTIPDGTYYKEGDLTLSASALRRVKQKRIHASGMLLLESSVTPENLVESVEILHSDKLIVCPEGLKDVVLDLTEDPAVEVLGYAGKLRVIDGVYDLRSAELKYSKEPITFIVRGVMTIAADIEAHLLHDSLGFIVNQGVINAGNEHYGIVQMKMLKNNGVVSDSDETENHSNEPAGNDDTMYIRNANYLKL